MIQVEVDDLEAALEAAGRPWARRESAWVIPATENGWREVRIGLAPGGATVEVTLAEFDRLGEVEATALASFLAAAQNGLRFVRCWLTDNRACVGSHVAAADLERDLADTIEAASHAARALARSVEALIHPEVARAYRDFRQVA